LLAYSLVFSIMLVKFSFLIYGKEEQNGALRGAFGGGRFGSVRHRRQ
jgi:hypothetical protein